MDNTINPLKEQIDNIDIKVKELNELIKTSDDAEMIELAKDDIKSMEAQKKQLEDSIAMLEGGFSKSEDNNNNNGQARTTGDCIIEIRAGTGGDEAGLFANDLFNMYSKYAETKNWKVSVLSKNEGGIGNIKEISFEITGRSAPTPYFTLEHESGVHRVQRVPTTESSGRIHTSAATVAILPIVKDINIDIRTEDLKVDTYRASGAGGQHVNKTDSAIRITHMPTGLVVQCQDERSQHKNRERAMSMLNTKLYDMMQQQQKDSVADLRADQIGTGDRSEKIRTYNFPQDRVTDHRIKKSWFGMEKILNGEIDTLLKDVKRELTLLNPEV